MKINIKRTDEDYAMEAVNDNGNTIMMDGSLAIGGHGKGMRPMQVLLTALGGCTAIDVISILKKQRQRIDAFDVEVEGESEKVEEHTRYKSILVHFRLKGDIDPAKAERAAQLSFDKYCSVSKSLDPNTEIRFKMTVNA